MAEDKRTKIGSTGPPRARGETGNQAVAVPAATPVPASSTSAPTSYLPPQVDPLIGQTLMGRYAIHKKLGEGGMGAVYLATHNLLEKQVALKVLHGEFARKADLVERFMQEAKSASRIRHENVIDISDFGTTPDGLVFFAMELLKGHDLHEEVSRARLAGELLPWVRTKKIFLQICSALVAAHAHGIIHRDLKPENVYLIDFVGEPDFVKLLDFGIAKLTEVDEGGRKLTKTGMLFGTPEYMSPEQARGENVDHRVDIYAMGCILFQLVTGRVPFEADNFMGVLSLHLTEPPPSIPVDVFDRIGAPRELAGVIEKALQKDRTQRWSTIEDFANAVRTVSGDAPKAAGEATTKVRHASVPAPAATTTTRQRTQWTGNVSVPQDEDAGPKSRSKLPLILGALVVAAGAAGAVIYTQRGKPSGAVVDQGSGIATGSGAPIAAPGSGSQVPAGSGSQTVVATPPVNDLPPLTGDVRIKLTSKPSGATVRNLATDLVYGPTPITLRVKASRTALSLGLRLKGYADTIIDLTPDRDLEYKAPLEKGDASSAPKRQLIPTAKPTTGDSSAVTRPDPGTGSDATIKPPDAGSAAAVKPPDAGSAAKPPPPDDDCVDFPCVKKEVPGLKETKDATGSGSGG